MPFEIHRRNVGKNETTIAPITYATGVEAFDAAWDNMGEYMKNQIRSGSLGDLDGPASTNRKYKIYVETRQSRGVGFELRYDFPTVVPNDPFNTNSIHWRIIQV